jgi:2',3'-cyclic-nucleotide 2'-phosphodiesterase (5'-nucleotidase family)
MLRNFFYIFHLFLIGAGLSACSFVSPNFHSAKIIPVAKVNPHPEMDSMLYPFREAVNAEMNVVLASSTVDFFAGRPNGNLNNWFADAIFQHQTRNIRIGEPVFCLFNVGGLRSSLPKGDVTLKDVYKLMPFDNEIVWVKFPMSVLPEIVSYLNNSGGEPIANARLENGTLVIAGSTPAATHFWVITSDYLRNGGDKMYFFAKATETIFTGQLIRDALIEEVKLQKTLVQDTLPRIIFN